MKKYEYDVVSPSIEDGKFSDGYVTETATGLFGKEKTVYKEKYISEKQWLNRKGEEGWELVNILRNSISYDIKDYYFKREINDNK